MAAGTFAFSERIQGCSSNSFAGSVSAFSVDGLRSSADHSEGITAWLAFYFPAHTFPRKHLMRSAFLLVCSYVVLSLLGARPIVPAWNLAPAPVVISGSVRESLPDDYLRVSFLPAGTPITNLSRPGALRAFTTATALYSPPLKLADMPYYSGLVNNDAKVLVAMRCRPPHPEVVDAVLATWPNVFLAVQRDVPLASGVCAATPTDPATQMACFAKAFDRSSSRRGFLPRLPIPSTMRPHFTMPITRQMCRGCRIITEYIPPLAEWVIRSRILIRWRVSP